MNHNFIKQLFVATFFWMFFSVGSKAQAPLCHDAFQACGPDGFRMMFLYNFPEVGDMLYLYSESNPTANGYYMVDSEYGINGIQGWFNISSAPCGYYDLVIFPDGTILTLNPQGTGADCWCVANNGGDECPTAYGV